MCSRRVSTSSNTRAKTRTSVRFEHPFGSGLSQTRRAGRTRGGDPMNADILDRQVPDRSSEPWHVARADRPHLVLVPTGPSVRPSREPRMRLTRRGRLVVLVLVAAILVVLLNAVAGSLASASGEVEQITVRAGQTLSGIAVDRSRTPAWSPVAQSPRLPRNQLLGPSRVAPERSAEPSRWLGVASAPRSVPSFPAIPPSSPGFPPGLPNADSFGLA